MHAIQRGSWNALCRIAATCIVILSLVGCNPNDVLAQREDDYTLGDGYVGSIILFTNSTEAPDFFSMPVTVAI